MDSKKTSVQRALQKLVRQHFDRPISAAEIDDLARKQVGETVGRTRRGVASPMFSVATKPVDASSIPVAASSIPTAANEPVKPISIPTGDGAPIPTFAVAAANPANPTVSSSGRRGSPIAVGWSDSDGESDDRRRSSMIDRSPFVGGLLVVQPPPSVSAAAVAVAAVATAAVSTNKPIVGRPPPAVRLPPVDQDDGNARPRKRPRNDDNDDDEEPVDLNEKESAAARVLASSPDSPISSPAPESPVSPVSTDDGFDFDALAGRLTPPMLPMLPMVPIPTGTASKPKTKPKPRRSGRFVSTSTSTTAASKTATPSQLWQRRLDAFRNVSVVSSVVSSVASSVAHKDDPFNPKAAVWKAYQNNDLQLMADLPLSKFCMPEDLSRGRLFIIRKTAVPKPPKSPPSYAAPAYGY
jgi:hypothetical protein